jgi:DNA-binding MarR family transcriptional regulator
MAKPFYRPETYGARTSIGYLLRRLNNLMTPRAEARFASQDLTFSHWVALICLRDGVVGTCADIARHLNHDSGATTRLVDQLESRGLVARNRSKTDRRVVHLTLTPKGRAVTKALAPTTIDFWNEALSTFTAAEATTLIGLLSRLLQRLEEMPEEQPAAKTKVAS